MNLLKNLWITKVKRAEEKKDRWSISEIMKTDVLSF
jgi:hypothetical protein